MRGLNYQPVIKYDVRAAASGGDKGQPPDVTGKSDSRVWPQTYKKCVLPPANLLPPDQNLAVGPG
jgi:hypothetical protein